MSIPSGLSNQLGIAEESAYGTFVAPTRFLEFMSESLAPDKQVLPFRSMGSQFQKANSSRHYIRGGGGPIELPFMNQGMGLLLKHALGAVASAQVGATDYYAHTFTPAADGGAGDFLTVQKGLADTGGTVRPFNYVGSKITTWTLSQALDAYLLFRATIDAKTVQTSSGLATASYPDDLTPLAFVDAVFTIDTTEICINQFEITGTRALDVNRRCLGNTKREPVANGEYAITGVINREFEGMDQYDDWIAGTPGALVCTWTYGDFSLVVTLPVVEYTGDAPQSNGSEIVRQNLPFKALEGDDPTIEIVYTTTDVTP